jgi:hypothetical protein
VQSKGCYMKNQQLNLDWDFFSQFDLQSWGPHMPEFQPAKFEMYIWFFINVTLSRERTGPMTQVVCNLILPLATFILCVMFVAGR